MNDKGNVKKPLLTIPTVASEEVQFHIPKKLNIYEFYTISDGQKRIYTEEDGINDLGKQVILDPCKVSYMNLFINGVLQPKESYDVQSGAIILKTSDVPTEGAPLILQMIKL
ncbi:MULTISPECIES: DUF4183 domain-containing protein [Bacillus]|jgi:hypothetical protein|uniref:DUF4183 domain-containing protein n=1 Tax=Bacillus capparidis TaxID=1840411 RepID=A0ABS4D188_9BACI|nr:MULTISPECIES: DUF4183 domain-containing protein [Bacillus]MBP1083358.1 hypothetical protein [Bacillus capparidis]MED1097790.1 DUF4183 domain-containing protein [Bacillus capparidis]